MVRVIIAGGRDFDNFYHLESKCHKVFYELSKDGILSGHVKEDIKNMEIVSGTAKGADKLGESFASQYKIHVKRFPADWDAYGKSAGYIRNEQMAKYAMNDNNYGVLIAFWDGKSRGTKHMIDLANKHGLKVYVENYSK